MGIKSGVLEKTMLATIQETRTSDILRQSKNKHTNNEEIWQKTPNP